MIKLGAVDSLTKDRIIRLSACQKARDFLELASVKERLLKNDKMTLSEAEYHYLAAITANYISAEYIGGSAFNTTATITAALPQAQTKFITPPSANKSAVADIKNLTFLPTDPADAYLVDPRISFILLDEMGDKKVLKYLGSIYDYLSGNQKYMQAMISALTDVIEDADLFFLPGGITKKFPYQIFSHVLNEITRNNAKLVFTLPTHSDFTAQEMDLYKAALSKAAIILGNADELRNMMMADKITSLNQLAQLPCISFITDGGNDAYVIAGGKITPICPLPLTATVISVTGAGDSAFAGFITGLLLGHDVESAAKTAMVFAHEILKIPNARLPEPKILLAGLS